MVTERTPPDRRRFRWIRFRLGTLLLLVSAVGVWLGLTVNRVHNQQKAVQAIEALEGVIHFDYQYDLSGRFLKDAELDAPSWLQSFLDDDYFRDVVVVDFAYGSGGLRRPRSKACDDDLAHLEHLTAITNLELGRNRAITDRGLKHLRRLKNLEGLNLHRTNVEGPGLIHLTNLPKLRFLNLEHSRFSDAGSALLGQMKQLHSLRLGNTQITDKSAADLAQLGELRDLSLANTDVSDAVVPHLKRLRNLESLNLHGTNLTAAGLAELTAALPNCRIYVSYGLGEVPETPPLWDPDSKPAREELLRVIKEAGGLAETDDTLPGQPIVSLALFDSKLSDAALIRILEQLPNLNHLNLRRVVVGDELLVYLGQRKGLTFLSLMYSRISNAGLQHLAGITDLNELDLSGTRISDKGLRSLARLSQVRQLYVTETRLTEQGLIDLQRALPNCSISY